jgi:short subunit dehydrogenase-like uncharacterized protein
MPMKTKSEVLCAPDFLRGETLATRVSVGEMRAIETDAAERGITRSNWLRNAAVAYLNGSNPTTRVSLESTLLKEVMALRLVVLNLFTHAISGLSIETVKQIMAHADSAKHAQAAEVLRRARENPV